MDFKQKIIEILQKATNQKEIEIEIPPDSSMGDYAFPCFSLAKVYKKNPADIAKELKDKINEEGIIDRIEVKGPYLNFFVNKNKIVEDTIKKIIKEKDKYGSSNVGKGKKALIEHTSINPNASPHVGRARNALIGDSITGLLKFQGYKVETHYFVNDVGKQIAMLVLGCKGKKNLKFNDLLKIYININKKIEEKPELEKDVFDLLHKLEQKDKKVVDEFKKVVNICVKGQIGILSELGIEYDKFDYESDYLWKELTKDVLKKLEKTGKLFTDEEGRLVLDQKEYSLSMKSPVLVLTRADKTSLYPLRDMAYTIDKINKGFHKNIIVLGEDQKLYFQQLKAGLNLLGYEAPEVIHYSFVLLAEGKMSTRKGNLVLLEDFMKEALDKAKEEIKKRHDKTDEKAARKIAYGAIKYSVLRVSPEKNVVFDWQQALNFEGDSGPYLQYAYVRINSVLEKYGKKVDEKADFSLLKQKEETELIKKLSAFPAVIEDATKQLKTHLIASYLTELSQLFSNFYHSCQILKEEENLKKARLLLAYCTKQVLANGLNLLGIDVLERM